MMIRTSLKTFCMKLQKRTLSRHPLVSLIPKWKIITYSHKHKLNILQIEFFSPLLLMMSFIFVPKCCLCHCRLQCQRHLCITCLVLHSFWYQKQSLVVKEKTPPPTTWALFLRLVFPVCNWMRLRHLSVSLFPPTIFCWFLIFILLTVVAQNDKQKLCML